MIDQPPVVPTSEPLGPLVAGLIGVPADATCAIDGASETVLPDGAIVCVRPISQRDRGLLAEGYSRLSEESRQRRFLSVAKRLSDRQLTYFTDVDHRLHEAVVALDPESRRLIGIAEYVCIPGDPGSAEISAMVVDDWQHRGVGTALFGELTRRAASRGVKRFVAIVSPENRPVIAALEKLRATRSSEGGEYVYRWRLPTAAAVG